MSFQQQSKLVLCPSKMDFSPKTIYLVLRYHYYITELLCTVNNLYFRIKIKCTSCILYPIAEQILIFDNYLFKDVSCFRMSVTSLIPFI